MKNQFNIQNDLGDTKNNYEEQGGTPYISISDSSNMQVESSHFSLNNKNSSPLVNNNQNVVNHNNNNNLISSNSGFLSLSKSIINNNINISHNNNNNSGIQISLENVSLSGSNKLQISSNSIIFKKNDISKNSIFLSPSTLCNYYQQSNDVTPYKSPLVKQPEHEHELIHDNETSSGKEGHKLKQINIDILHKRKNTSGSINNRNASNINSNLNNINNNNCENTSRSDECGLDDNKTLSSQRKYVFDKKTPIKYAKNQLKSGEKNKSAKSNNSKLENNNSNSNLFENKNNILEEEEKKIRKNRGIIAAQNKNGRNLMDTFDKVGNGKDTDDNLKFFNNRRQPTEYHLTPEELKININNNILDKNESNNNFNKQFIDRLDDDSSFMEKDNNNNNKSNNENEEINLLDKMNEKKENETKNIINDNNINNNNNNINLRNEKIEKKKEYTIKDNNNYKEIKELNANTNTNNNIPLKKEDNKKICIKKILPTHKKENNNIAELSKNIIKELTRTNYNKRKEGRTKSRPSSFTKNIIINFNSFNSIGVNNNNNNIDNNIGFKSKKPTNVLIKKTKYNNEFKINNDIFDKKPKNRIANKNNNQDCKKNNNTLEPLHSRRKLKIPNRIGKKEKHTKEISISNITNNKEKKRPPSSENYNRRATSFSNLKQTMNANLFHNSSNSNNNNQNNTNTINNNRNISKKNSNSNYSTTQKNFNKNQFKKQKPLIENLFVEENSRQQQKSSIDHISHNQQIQNNSNNNNCVNNKNNQQENTGHKMMKKKIKLLVNKKENNSCNSNTNNSNSNNNNNTNITNINSNLSNNNDINDRNYQTVSSVSRNMLEVKMKNKYNDKKDNDELIKKKESKTNKSSYNSEFNIDNNNANVNNNNSNINNINNSNINNNNIQIKKKEEQKVKIIQNFSSYHKIKYKSHIPEKINFAETQPKQFNVGGGFYKCNKNNNNTIKENIKYNNNTYQHKGDNGNNVLNNNNDNKNNYIIKQVKFRKLEKLPGDSDSGDVDLNDECI